VSLVYKRKLIFCGAQYPITVTSKSLSKSKRSVSSKVSKLFEEYNMDIGERIQIYTICPDSPSLEVGREKESSNPKLPSP
jgi:hypothetical protein